MEISDKLLKELPKVELHCHLDGSLRVDTIIDLASKDSISLPSTNPNNLKKMLSIGQKRVTLEEYISRFDITLSVMQTPDSLKRIAYELIEDVASENVRYIEVRYSPILHTAKGMTLLEAITSVKDGLKKGKEDFGVKSGIIICGIRHISPEASLKLADLCVKFKNNGVVGFDLAGAEENFPAKDHREAFYMILNHNINATIHAGEAFGPSSIHQAIHYCGAHRIGHGTRLKEDKDLMNYVNNHRITMEVCLTSNWHTYSVQSLKEHPLKYYYDRGIRVTLNTDNRLMSDTTLTKEFCIARDLFSFKLHDFREITIIAMKAAFVPHLERKEMIKNIADEMESKFGILPEYKEHGKKI
jgi:adenosine deaminase